MLGAQTPAIDLKLAVLFGHSGFTKGMTDAFGANRLFPSDGLLAPPGISPLCRALSRRLQGAEQVARTLASGSWDKTIKLWRWQE